jgi:ABC transporter substrate binding protein (PQQ-dependent alcohol dehydrogenase system)
MKTLAAADSNRPFNSRCCPKNAYRKRGLLQTILMTTIIAALAAMATSATAAAEQPAEIKIGFLRMVEKGRLTISILDAAPDDLGLAGAKVAINDNNTTGKFMNQTFSLADVQLGPEDDPLPQFEQLSASGIKFIIADIPAADLLKVTDAAAAMGILVFNSGTTDDSLREEDCRANLFHTAPTRSMLADGLAQYLVWKKWRRWLLVYGSHPEDGLWADALRRAATRFGAEIVEEREFKDTGGARQTDSGVAQVQRQIPVFTQGAADYDVLVAADESEVFATYLPYRTWDPRPVAGSAGLMPMSWHPAHELWGAAQIQNRFEKASGRRMLPKDIQAWTAIRIIGEGATRTKSDDVEKIATFIRDPAFSIAAFKGQRVTFRRWNWQLRQPVLLADAKGVISVSPQEGFLHQFSELDTLGIDQPETACKLQP